MHVSNVCDRQLSIHMCCLTTSCGCVSCTDARIKSKFWGKSMEVFPIGVTNVLLPK